MNTKAKIIILVVVCLIGYAFGRYLQPTKVITKTETQIVKVEVEKERIEYRTIVRYITKKDGTTVKEEITEEIKDKESVITKKKEKKELKIVENAKPQWKAQVAAELVSSQATTYRVGVEKRVLGPFFAGAWAETNFHSYGVSLSMEF